MDSPHQDSAKQPFVARFFKAIWAFACSPITSITTWLWGYDFFISYHWNSGGTYAMALASSLQERYDVFIDRSEYAIGENWRVSGKKALDRSRAVILVATPDAVSNSEPVKAEIDYFASRSADAIIPIYFPGVRDNSVLTAPVLVSVGNAVLYFEESDLALQRQPSAQVIERLHQRMKLLRKRFIRQVVVVTSILVLLTAAVWAGMERSITANMQLKMEFDDSLGEFDEPHAGAATRVRFGKRPTTGAISYVNHRSAGRAVTCTLTIPRISADDIQSVLAVDRLDTLILEFKIDDQIRSIEANAFDNLSGKLRIRRLLIKDLDRVEVLKEPLKSIVALESLDVLACINCGLRSADIEPLFRSKLSVLCLAANGLDSECWKVFAKMSNLRELYLDTQDVLSDGGLAVNEFAARSSVQALSLSRINECEPKAIQSLLLMPSLTTLNLAGNRFLANFISKTSRPGIPLEVLLDANTLHEVRPATASGVMFSVVRDSDVLTSMELLQSK